MPPVLVPPRSKDYLTAWKLARPLPPPARIPASSHAADDAAGPGQWRLLEDNPPRTGRRPGSTTHAQDRAEQTQTGGRGAGLFGAAARCLVTPVRAGRIKVLMRGGGSRRLLCTTAPLVCPDLETQYGPAMLRYPHPRAIDDDVPPRPRPPQPRRRDWRARVGPLCGRWRSGSADQPARVSVAC